MQSSLIGKIEKAKRYAEEPERVSISNFTAVFRGENDSHTIGLSDGKWHCNCHFFAQWGECVHIMTLQRLLGKMVPAHINISQQD
ncbi:MAG: hypothetical protein JXA01_06555 [Dehalococcoidia bacterium]|nr:hypothetical protein [Dehalococcoidia bacterium]